MVVILLIMFLFFANKVVLLFIECHIPKGLTSELAAFRLIMLLLSHGWEDIV